MPDIDRCSAPSNACSTTTSVASLKKKKGQVELRLATFVKQLDEKRFQQPEIDRQKVKRTNQNFCTFLCSYFALN